MDKITSENACQYEISHQTISYYLAPESFDENGLTVSLIKIVSEKYEEISREKLFTKPFMALPKKWITGSEMSISFGFLNNELHTEKTSHLLKTISKRMVLCPLFDKDGRCYGSEKFLHFDKTFLEKHKNRKIKLSSHTIQEEPMALLWFIQIQGKQVFSERKQINSQELIKKLGFEKYEKEFWAIPIYVNKHLAGARVVSDVTNVGYHTLHTAITVDDFLAL